MSTSPDTTGSGRKSKHCIEGTFGDHWDPVNEPERREAFQECMEGFKVLDGIRRNRRRQSEVSSQRWHTRYSYHVYWLRSESGSIVSELRKRGVL